MTLSTALDRSNELADLMDRDIHGLNIPATDRARLAGALLDQALEHHHAIRLLLANGDTGSAFALVRVLFETTIRGSWLSRCATETQVQQFKKDIAVASGDIINALEKVFSTVGGVLTKIKSDYWQGMCSYSHGGYLQAVRRLTDEHVTPNYSEDEKLQALSFADFCLVLASVEICALAGNDELASKCGERYPKAAKA